MKKKKELLIAGLICLFVTSVFFYKTIFFGKIPFPGDLLVSEYKPWQSYSYLGYTPGSYPSKAQYFDTIRQLYPWKQLVIDSLKEGSVPLWNPHNFAGSPLLANSQSSVLYPFWFSALIFPLPFIWTILVMLQPLLTYFFTYLYCRKIGLSAEASLFSGLIAGFSLFQTVFLEYNTIGHVVLWLPLALFGFEMWKDNRNVRSALYITIPLTLSGLAGHLQIYFFVLAFFHVYAISSIINTNGNLREKSVKILHLLILTLLSAGLGSAQHFPTAELVTVAARVNQQWHQLVNRLLIQPKQLFMLFVPDIFGNPASRNYVLGDSYPGKAMYIGLLPLFFVHIAMKAKKTSFYISFFTFFSSLLLLFLVHTPFAEFIYKFNIPLLSTGSPTNALFLFSFSFAVLAGFGYDVWKKSKFQFPVYTVALVFIIFMVLWTLRLTSPALQFSAKNMIYSTGLAFTGITFFFLSSKIKKILPLVFFVIMSISVADLSYFFQKFNPFVPREFVYPPAGVTSWIKDNAGFNRFWGYGSATIEANFATQLGIFSPDGYDPLYPRIYGEFIASSRNGELLSDFDTSTRSDALIASGYGEDDFRNNIFRKKVLNILGVKYIVNRTENGLTEKSLPPDIFTQVYSEDGWSIIENNKALPRAFLADSYKLVSEESFAREFFSETFNPSSTVLLNEEPDIIPQVASTKSADITEYTPNQLTVSSKSDTSQVLFLSDTFFPGWNAYVNGQKTKILRANHTFRAVALPAGVNTVVFAYEPESFSTGVKVFMICAGMYIAYVVIIIYKKK